MSTITETTEPAEGRTRWITDEEYCEQLRAVTPDRWAAAHQLWMEILTDDTSRRRRIDEIRLDAAHLAREAGLEDGFIAAWGQPAQIVGETDAEGALMLVSEAAQVGQLVFLRGALVEQDFEMATTVMRVAGIVFDVPEETWRWSCTFDGCAESGLAIGIEELDRGHRHAARHAKGPFDEVPAVFVELDEDNEHTSVS